MRRILQELFRRIVRAMAAATKPKPCRVCGQELGSNRDCDNCFDAAYYDRAAP